MDEVDVTYMGSAARFEFTPSVLFVTADIDLNVGFPKRTLTDTPIKADPISRGRARKVLTNSSIQNNDFFSCYFAPIPNSTAGIVLSIILKSSNNDH